MEFTNEEILSVAGQLAHLGMPDGCHIIPTNWFDMSKHDLKVFCDTLIMKRSAFCLSSGRSAVVFYDMRDAVFVSYAMAVSGYNETQDKVINHIKGAIMSACDCGHTSLREDLSFITERSLRECFAELKANYGNYPIEVRNTCEESVHNSVVAYLRAFGYTCELKKEIGRIVLTISWE